MSEFIRNQIKTQSENAELFKGLGMNWLSKVCNKEAELYKNGTLI